MGRTLRSKIGIPSESSRIIASQVKGAVNIIFNTGCSDVQANTDMSQKILTGFTCSPIVRGEKTYQEMGREMLQNIQDE